MQPENSGTDIALLVDGSALYFAARHFKLDNNLNYRVLDRLLSEQCHGSWPPRYSLFFSSVEESNEKSRKFVQFIEREVKWKVIPTAPQDSSMTNAILAENPVRMIRFDAWIAYALGRFAGDASIQRVFVVTDSWPLAGPVQDLAKRRKDVTVVFFGTRIDPRWHRLFQGKEVPFMDLDEHVQVLFGKQPTPGSIPERPSSTSFLP